MKKILLFTLVIFVGALGCTNRDGEIIDLINSIKKQNEDLKLQITALKKTTDSALVVVTKVYISQAATDKKIDGIQADLKSILTQISNISIQMTNEKADLTSLHTKLDALQLKCSELIAQITALNVANNLFTIAVDLSPVSAGQITITPALASYKAGTEVTITVTPNSNYVFQRWSGDVSGSSLPLKIIVDGNKKITAQFDLKSTQSVTDLDGNKYTTVSIGTQVWMKENLNVTKYQNGDPIPNITDGQAWGLAKSGAWSRYNNDSNASNSQKIGLLYNGFAAQDSRNVCPTGYRVPSDVDLQELTKHLGGGAIAGEKLKEANGNTSLWATPNLATNSSGFTALPTGQRWGNYDVLQNFGRFEAIFYIGHFWTNSSLGSNGISWVLFYNSPMLKEETADKSFGKSIRCIKN
ncbi:MAG: hypothetical protein RLZZ474_1678 [Bacteroidota bacterium]|jgi:uncharacterized protein (TIGR02145 family)